VLGRKTTAALAEQLRAQRAVGVIGLEQAPLLERRHDQIDEVGQAFRGYRAGQVDAVDIGGLDP
jgi:hypothetical protein